MSTELSIYRGETKTWTFTVTDNGVAMDITLATINFAARRTLPGGTIVSDADAAIAKSTAGGIVITDGVNGVFELTLLKADTNTLEVDQYYYGVKLIPAGETEPYVVEEDILNILAHPVRAI